MIIHDFAYADLGFDGYKPPSILQVDGAKEVAVEIFSMSKSYNMAGWRVGFCVGNPKMIAALARIKSYLDYGVFQPIQIASIIALARVRRGHRKDLRHLPEAARRAGARTEARRLAGGEAARVDVPVGADAGEVSRRRVAGILPNCCWRRRRWRCRRGSGSGRWAKDFVRFALVENDQRIRQATRSIGQFLKC